MIENCINVEHHIQSRYLTPSRNYKKVKVSVILLIYPPKILQFLFRVVSLHSDRKDSDDNNQPR
ncbi:hypothetical protein GCM10027342_16740 [Photobacterium alginatilyticum]